MDLRLVLLLLGTSCGRSPIYAACEQPDDCPAPEGVTAECLDKSSEGFCTWSCSVDSDCSFDEDDYERVCASFESEQGKYCFPSCEGEDEGDEACPPGFGCRSTGGGSDNRKVCFPEDLEDGEDSPQ